MMENPVLAKEIRTRFRYRKARGIKLAIGIPAAVVIAISYWRLIAAMLEDRSADVDVWAVAAFLQLMLLCFITPGLLSNAISQEKEQRTWGLLLVTRLTPWQILSGKLVARLLPIPILMAMFVPFMAYSAAKANLSAWVVVGTYLILFSCIFLFGVQALFWSWLLRKTSVATAAAYGSVFFLTVGTIILDELVKTAGSSYNEETPIMWFNPFYALIKLSEWGEAHSGHAAIWLMAFITAAYISVSWILLAVMKGRLEKVQPE